MDRLLFVSMNGARQTLSAQAANSNNLANVSTTGFQSDLMAAQDWQVKGPGFASRVHARLARAGFDAAPGNISATGRDLDVAVVGPGWFAVQAFDGAEAYTRAGDMQISAGGVLVNGQGHIMLGDDGPITLPPAKAVEVSSDGTVSVKPAAGGPLAVVGRLKLVSAAPNELDKGPDGLLRPKDGLPLQANAGIKVQAGAIEGSNVNAVESLVSMIELARLFETQVQMMNVADENATATNSLLRLRG